MANTTYQNFHTVDGVRLEVETDVTDLPNIIPNPDGQQGAFGWLTPVTNTTMSGSPGDLRFTTVVSQAAYFTSTPMTAVAGNYYKARLDVLSFSVASNIRLKFEFLDNTQTLISSSTQSAAITAAGTTYYGPYQAPANTAYVRLRVDFYTSTGTGNPGAGTYVDFRRVMVTYSATGTSVQTRTNLITNPSVETNTTGWTSGNTGTLSRVSSPTPQVGSFCLKCPAASGVSGAVNLSPASAVSKNTVYTFSVYARGSASGTLKASYFGNSSSTVNGPSISISSTAWTRYTWTFNSGNNTNLNYFYLNATGATTDLFIDGAQLEAAPAVGTYFDGSTVQSGYTYAWTGTANASTSTETSGTANFNYVDSTNYVNIMGSAAQINVTRRELDVGTLTADIHNDDLDPAISTFIRPGRKVRLTTTPDSGVTWTPVFTGTILNGSAVYDYTTAKGKRAKITLTATDNVTQLAKTAATQSVANVNDLPFILESANVPWNVNGNTGQVASATVTGNNDSATVADQVALTRDSKSAYAWVDQSNVLQVWDQTALNGTNLVPNPSFETNTTGWAVNQNCTISRATTSPINGTGSLAITATGAGLAEATTPGGTSGIPVTPNATYTYSATFRQASGTARTPRLGWFWFNAAGSSVGAFGVDGPTSDASATTFSFAIKAPPTAAFVQLLVSIQSPANGEIHYVDDVTLSLPVAAAVPLDETIYNADMNIDYDTDRCINTVNVTRQYIGADGSTVEDVFGPYTDTNSVSQWGPHASDFTVTGIAAASIPAFASKVLLANATPQVRLNSVTIPIKDLSTDYTYATLDLYDLVSVSNTPADITTQPMRITGVTHSLIVGTGPNPHDSWLVTLDFSREGAVAAPLLQPAVTGGAVYSNGVNQWYNSTVTTNIGNTTIATVTGWSPVANGAYYTTGSGIPGAGQFTVNVAGTYVINASVTWSSNATGRRYISLYKNGTEQRRVDQIASNNQMTMQVAHIAQLAVGDVIDVRVFQNVGTTLALAASPGHDFQIARLGD